MNLSFWGALSRPAWSPERSFGIPRRSASTSHQNHDHGLSHTDPIDLREAEIAKIAESREDLAALRERLQEITESKAFKGSHRSGQFLAFIIERAIEGRFDSLKERVIGVELFGRSPSYDTGEDAIVRVTASDVRKRLLQYYGENGRSSRFHLSLPLGSYIPEITRHPQVEASPVAVSNSLAPAGGDCASLTTDLPSQAADMHVPAQTRFSVGPRHRFWFSFAVVLLFLNLMVWGLFWAHTPKADAAAVSVLPWSVFFNSSHVTHLITSDPNIVALQEITGTDLSVSDYANRKYIPDPDKLTPEELRLSHFILWGDNSAAAIDPPIALRIASLPHSGPLRIDARAARGIQLSDLKSDDNFILLGSPRSNPWSALFSDQLDFRFIFDHKSGQEIIQNVHPRPHELPMYVPTAQGWATGQSFAIIAFVQNPDQNGQVLLLAGANGEGTEAAGRLATDLPRLSAALTQCGIHSGKLRHFELLLGLNTMAGSPNDVDIVACHALPAGATR